MITPEELIQRATLLSAQNTEIEWREGIKHAYYSVYHLAKDFADSKQLGNEVSHQNLGEHQHLIERIKSLGSALAKAFARDMQMLKDKRTLSCYYLNDNVSKMMSYQQVIAAKKAIERLENLKSSC